MLEVLVLHVWRCCLQIELDKCIVPAFYVYYAIFCLFDKSKEETKLFRLAKKTAILSGLALVATATIGIGVSNADFAWSGASVTPEESQKMHQTVSEMKDQLVDAILGGVKYDTISYSSSEYVNETPDVVYWNDPTEPNRKAAKFNYAKNLAKSLGFPIVVQRNDAMYVYAEFGDPDAPEMVMALSHLDSPPASVSTSNMPRWVRSPWTPYIKDGWMYGCGLQDDSGPTLATLFGAKAIMDSGYAIDRRVRVVMGGFEDNSPSNRRIPLKNGVYTPTQDGGMTSSFYDNWCYKLRHQEEMPVGSFTSDSRFPVIYGNTVSWNCDFTKDISIDDGKDFSLLDTKLDVTHYPETDKTIKHIIYGSGVMVPSRAAFTLRIPDDAVGSTSSNGDKERMDFQAKFNLAIVNAGWEVEDFKYDYSTANDYGCKNVTITIDTKKAMETPTPAYGSNAYVRMMYGLSKALPDGLEVKTVAENLSFFFAPDGVEDVRGYNLGCGGKHPKTGYEMMTIALGYSDTDKISGEKYFPSPYDPVTGKFTARLYTRSLWETKDESNAKWMAHVTAFTDKGWTKTGSMTPPTGLPTLYAPADSPLVKTMFEAYQFGLQQPGFDDADEIFKNATPLGTTGGTLASDYYGKQIAYGAIIPGNERWWHAPNERMTVDSAVQMTQLYTDGFLALARYPGTAGAQIVKADFDGYDSSRSELAQLDVTIGTYQDARNEVIFDGAKVVAATKFNIPVFKSNLTSTQRSDYIALGHEQGGIYLNVDSISEDLILPLRLEMKLTPDSIGASQETWNTLKAADVATLLKTFKFYVMIDGKAVALEAPEGKESLYFFKRTSQYSDNIYLSAYIAVADTAGNDMTTAEVSSIMPKFADEKNRYIDTAAETRGFFVIKDGKRDAEFTSPVTFVAADNVTPPRPSNGGSSSGCNSGFAGLMALLALPALFIKRKKR